MKTWKRRWFILTDNCLYYFEYTTVSDLCLGCAGPGQRGGLDSAQRSPACMAWTRHSIPASMGLAACLLPCWGAGDCRGAGRSPLARQD